jgi:hypothetical protein
MILLAPPILYKLFSVHGREDLKDSCTVNLEVRNCSVTTVRMTQGVRHHWVIFCDRQYLGAGHSQIIKFLQLLQN